MEIIRHPDLYSSPEKVFRRVIKPFWPTPAAGTGVVCLFPTQALLEYWEERLIQEAGSFGGARFLLFAGLVREIWEENRPDWFSLPSEAVTLILRKIFLDLKAQGRLPYYAKALESPGFFSALQKEITALKRSGVSAQAFAGWLEKESGDKRLAQRDFSLIYQEYQSLLSANRWADAEEKLSLAILDLKKSLWANSLRHLFVIGFSDFTCEQERFLEEFARITKVTVLLDASAEGRQGVYIPRLKLERKNNGQNLSRQEVRTCSAGEVGPSLPPVGEESSNLSFIQNYLWLQRPSVKGTQAEEDDESLRFLQIDGGWRREMKTVALKVKKVLAHNPNLSPAEIGIITPYTGNMEELYEILVHTGLPLTGQAKRVLRQQPVARALLQPFVAAANDYSWAEMIKLLRWAGVIPGENLYLTPPQGLEEWRRVINDLYPDLENGYVFAFLEKIPQKAGLKEFLFLCQLWLATPQLLAALLPSESRQAVLNKARFMQAAIVPQVREVLSKLTVLLESIGDWELTLGEFISLLEDVLATSAKSLLHGWGKGVRILSPQEARGLRFKVTFLTGLNEGLWPTHSSGGWVLKERDLSFWKERGFSLKTAAEDLAMQRLAFYTALTSATETVVVSCCRSDEGGHPLNPSIFWEDLRDLVPNIPLHTRGKGFSLLYSTLPAPEKTRSNPLNSPAVTKAEAERRQGNPAYNGVLGSDGTHEVCRRFVNKPISITALEEYAFCPFAFYCMRLLNLTELTEPSYLPDRMEEGSILHQVLKDFFRKYRGETLKAAEYTTYLKEVRELMEQHYPETPLHSPVIYKNLKALNKEAMLAKLSRLVQEEILWQEKTAGAYRPRFLELGFGGPVLNGDEDSTEEPFAIGDVMEVDGTGGLDGNFTIGGNDCVTDGSRGSIFTNISNGIDNCIRNGGRLRLRLRLRGKIDRVDLGADGGFIVYDYKSSSTSRVKEVKEGKLLQLPLYLQAVKELYPEAREAVGMAYYSLNRSERTDGLWREGFGRRYRLKLKELTDEEWHKLLDLSRKKALEYYQGIISGTFPLLPPEEKCPAYCRFKRVCRRGMTGGVDE